MTEEPIKIFIVEDVAVIRRHLEFVFESIPDMKVIGTASNGKEAIEILKRIKPDVITMDIHMPEMDGFETTRYIMETTPVPIVIVSGSTNADEVAVTFKAVEAGAVNVTLKPPGIGHPDHDKEVKKFIELVRLMSEVKVVRRRTRLNNNIEPVSSTLLHNGDYKNHEESAKIDIIAIGASTGGPPVIKTILESLPASLNVPVLIVQHIAKGFTQGLVDWLNSSSKLPVKLALQGETALPGNVYIAPDDYHLGVSDRNILYLASCEPEYGLRPSVSFLFRSVAESFGKHAACVLLTGMGFDGAEEMLFVKQRGGITIAQDAETSVVHGMPGQAIRLNAAMYILAPQKIAETLVKITVDGRRN